MLCRKGAEQAQQRGMSDEQLQPSLMHRFQEQTVHVCSAWTFVMLELEMLLGSPPDSSMAP